MATQAVSSEAHIWSRVIEPEKNSMSPDAARSILALTFNERDKKRMQKLAEKNQEGDLTAKERDELEAYVKVGDVLSLMHLKAKKSLQK